MFNKLIITLTLLIAFFPLTAHADYYACGAFNGWNPQNASQFTLGADGLYRLEIDFSTGTEFKISTNRPTGGELGEMWAQFDNGALHVESTRALNVGVALTAGVDNSVAPSDQRLTLVINPAVGKLAYTDGTGTIDWGTTGSQPATGAGVYACGQFQGWNPSTAVEFNVGSDGLYYLEVDFSSGTVFKMSHTRPEGEYHGQSAWTQFDATAFQAVEDAPLYQAVAYEDGTQNTNAPANRTLTVVLNPTLKKIAFTDGASPINWNGTVVPEDPTKYCSGTLPILYINTYLLDAEGNPILDGAGNKIYNNELIDKDLAHKNYFTAEYWLDMNGCKWMDGAKSVGSADEPLPTEIKARGNYTRTAFAKKPFKLKLGKKQNLLGLTTEKSKHYALLAHADDQYGYLRNFAGFNLGKRIGLPWTPSQQPVEVIINGDYRGLYFLTESIRVGDGRVPVEELKDNATDTALISGGYLVELDNYEEENQIRMDEKSCCPDWHWYDTLRVTWDTPEEYSPIQKQFVTDQFTAMNDYVGANDDRLWSYIDLDDAVRFYIVKEILSDVESYHGSTYLFRDRGEGQKWHFSPLWDMGNAFNGYTDSFFYNCDPYGNTWIPSFRCNAKFNAKLVETWLWFMSNGYNGIVDDIYEYTGKIAEAAAADARRWRNQPTPEGGQPVVDNTDINSRRSNALQRLNEKVNWLKQQWGDYTKGTYTEPLPDLTPAAPLPEYAFTGVHEVAVDAEASASTTAEYFDLNGRRVENPAPGNLYIVRRGTAVTKIVVR